MFKSFPKSGGNPKLASGDEAEFHLTMINTVWYTTSNVGDGDDIEGGGVCIDPRGLILTCAHSVRPKVKMIGSSLDKFSDKPYELVVKHLDAYLGLAILEVKHDGSKTFDYASFSDAREFPIGTATYGIYHSPQAPSFSLFPGYVASSVARADKLAQAIVIKTSSMVVSGSYGCPTFDAAGQIIGIVASGNMYTEIVPVTIVKQFMIDARPKLSFRVSKFKLYCSFEPGKEKTFF